MSLMNSQVVMGEPMLAAPRPFEREGYRRMGRIQNLGVLTVPAIPAVKPEEVAGLVAGTGLLIGSSFVDGKGSVLMAVLGGLAAALAGGSILMRMMSAAPIQPATGMPLAPGAPPPPAKPSLIQNVASQVQNYAPVAQALLPALKNLFESKPAAPAPSSSGSSPIVASYSQLMPTPAPADDSSKFITSL